MWDAAISSIREIWTEGLREFLLHSFFFHPNECLFGLFHLSVHGIDIHSPQHLDLKSGSFSSFYPITYQAWFIFPSLCSSHLDHWCVLPWSLECLTSLYSNSTVLCQWHWFFKTIALLFFPGLKNTQTSTGGPLPVGESTNSSIWNSKSSWTWRPHPSSHLFCSLCT